MKVKIVNNSPFGLPSYSTPLSAGMDLRAALSEHIELPAGYEAQVRPRSGLAAKHGISIVNSPGTIDADYRGEIKVILVNLSTEDFVIKTEDFVINPGERIAQMVVARHERVEWEEVDVLEASERGEGGFGSTGRK